MAVGSDSVSNLTHEITAYLEEKGVELIRCGSLAGEEADYVDAGTVLGIHYMQEDSPHQIGEGISNFLKSIG